MRWTPEFLRDARAHSLRGTVREDAGKRSRYAWEIVRLGLIACVLHPAERAEEFPCISQGSALRIAAYTDDFTVIPNGRGRCCHWYDQGSSRDVH